MALPREGEALVDERYLSRTQLPPGFVGRKPTPAIDLRKLCLLPGPRGPLHLEEIAPQRARVNVALDAPGADDLAAGLLQRSEGAKGSVDRRPGFFEKLAFGRLERFLGSLVFTLGD